MSDFSLFGETELIQHGFVVASVSGTPIIADASTNTKGAYVEIVSAANNITDSSAITVIISSEGATAAGFLIDISIGGAGSEEVIISNILFNTTSVAIQTSDKVKIPINIPAGQRISIRCQSQSSSATIPVYIKLAPSNFKQPESCSEVVSIGANESATRGIEVAANTVTFGSWVEITSSLSLDIKGFFISTQKGVVASWSNLVVSYQVALGGVGNEIVIFDGDLINQNSSESQSEHFSCVLMRSIASGERLSIRAVSSIANADANLDYIIYGII